MLSASHTSGKCKKPSGVLLPR